MGVAVAAVYRPAPGPQRRRPGQSHGRDGLAENVVEPHHEALARRPSVPGQAYLEQRLVDRRGARSAQQGAVQIEDRSTVHPYGSYRVKGSEPSIPAAPCRKAPDPARGGSRVRRWLYLFFGRQAGSVEQFVGDMWYLYCRWTSANSRR